MWLSKQGFNPTSWRRIYNNTSFSAKTHCVWSQPKWKLLNKCLTWQKGTLDHAQLQRAFCSFPHVHLGNRDWTNVVLASTNKHMTSETDTTKRELQSTHEPLRPRKCSRTATATTKSQWVYRPKLWHKSHTFCKNIKYMKYMFHQIDYKLKKKKQLREKTQKGKRFSHQWGCIILLQILTH